MNDWLYGILGIRTNFVRPPYGECGKDCVRFLNSHGFKVVTWSVDTIDWRYQFNNTVSSSLEPLDSWEDTTVDPHVGPIVLMHSRIRNTAAITLPHLLDSFNARGFKFVSIAECLGYAADQWYI